MILAERHAAARTRIAVPRKRQCSCSLMEFKTSVYGTEDSGFESLREYYLAVKKGLQ